MEIDGDLEIVRIAIAASAFLDRSNFEFNPSATALVMRDLK